MAKSKPSRPATPLPKAPVASAAVPANPPAQNPTLLVGSAVLFALWFIFLSIVALWG